MAAPHSCLVYFVLVTVSLIFQCQNFVTAINPTIFSIIHDISVYTTASVSTFPLAHLQILDISSTVCLTLLPFSYSFKVNLELLGDKYVKAVTESMMPTGVITEEYLDGLDRLRMRLGTSICPLSVSLQASLFLSCFVFIFLSFFSPVLLTDSSAVYGT